jgi:ATP-dependent Clp protease protease subunit
MDARDAVPPYRPDLPPMPMPPMPMPPVPATPAPEPLTTAGYTPPDPGLADLTARLLEQRRVLLTGFLDDDASTRASAALMWLDATGDDGVELHISCPDGDLGAAHALTDTIDLLGVPVAAYARGGIGGPALGPFCAAGHRRGSRLAIFRLQDPSVRFTGDADALDGHARHHRRALDTLHGRIAAATGQPLERVAADFAGGTLLGGAEAQRYGILHDLAGDVV